MEGSPDKKGAFRDTPVLDQYGLSCENDMSLLVQEDLITLGIKITRFHSRILCTWVHGLVTGVHHHNTDEKRPVADVNDVLVSFLCH